ncbi:MAG: hypothetical protein WD906_06095 [Anaerolineales bacterium]
MKKNVRGREPQSGAVVVSGVRLPQPRATWIPILTAAASFVISIYTFFVTSRPPDVEVISPRQIRVAQGGEGGAWVYAQPVLVASGRGERAEVVLDIRMHVEPLATAGGVDFRWDEVGTWQYDPVSQELGWTFLSDPSPLLFTAQTAQAPVLLFIGPPDWQFEGGTYRIVIEVDRAVDPQPARATLQITLSDPQVRVLDESGGRRFLTIMADG